MTSNPPGNAPEEGTSMKTEGVEHHAVYPPKVESVQILGYVKGADDRVKSRDIGRSIVIGGRCYYIFGDTFCAKAYENEYTGIQCNSVSKVSKVEPLVTHYLGAKPDAWVDWFIPLNREERDIEATVLPLRERFRVCLWCFGGVVETRPGLGWFWYEKSVYRGESEVQYCECKTKPCSHF
jgi:hypothetical protein